MRAIFRELISGSRSLEKTLRVAYLGPAYSYSHLAAIHRFGQSVELVPVASIGAVFEEINGRQADFGLVPIENSTDGRVADTLEMFTRLPARICGEVQLRIHHNLLGKCSRAEVEEVYSKPQALSQCRNWLAKHLPAARLVEVTSTTTAAQLAQDKPGAAAIASLQAGVQYGLDVLAADIEDNQEQSDPICRDRRRDGAPHRQRQVRADVRVAHQPGALADAMNVFKRNRLNLTWIESFPIARPEGGYMFFVELEGHETRPKVRKAITLAGAKSRAIGRAGVLRKNGPGRVKQVAVRSAARDGPVGSTLPPTLAVQACIDRPFCHFQSVRALCRDYHPQIRAPPTNRSTM